MGRRSKRGWFGLVVGVLALLSLDGKAQQNPRELFEQARLMEENTRNLNRAVETYRQVVALAKADRELTASALVRLAGVYHKLGKADEERAAYERVLNQFADVAEAANQARTRLAGGPAITAQTHWTGREVNTKGTVSPDGRYLSFSDPKTGDLAVRDLAAGTSRRLTAAPGDFTDWAEFSAISRDSKQIAYAWFVDKKQRYELRILPLEGTPQTSPRAMPDNSELSDVYPYDWSPDGRWIAVRVSRPDRTAQVGLVATSNLSLTVLKSIDWRGPTKMFFSPDGKYLAYDLPASDSSRQRDVFVLSVDGKREIVAVAHSSNDVAMGWTADGRSLLFGSDRTGTMGVWSVPVVDGHPSGAAVLVRPDVGPVNASLGVTTAGRLFLGFQTSGPNIFIASMDPSTGKLINEPKAIVDGYLQANRQPKWSPDGKSIAYLSNRPTGPGNTSGGENVLVVQSVETGQIREIRPLVSWFLNPGWAPDGSIVMGGSSLKGRRAIFHVDSEKGEVSEIVASPPGTCTDIYGYSSSPTGQFVVYRLGCNTSMTLMVRDLASGLDRELVRFKDLSGPSLSPDGRLVAYVSRDSSARQETLSVIPFEGGAARELFRVSSPMMLGDTIRWMPDGRRLIVLRGEGSKRRMVSVPLEGGAPLELDARLTFQMDIHPDGRQVTFGQGEVTHEVRSLIIRSRSGAP